MGANSKAVCTICLGALLVTACVGTTPVGTTPFRITEEARHAHPEGTLLVGEIVRPLARTEILARYSRDDLALAGWNSEDVVDGAAVVLTNFKQSQSYFSSAHVLYALVRKSDATNVKSSRTACKLGGGCTYGGDVVTLRVISPVNERSPSGTNVVEDLVEKQEVSGDCFYEDLGLFKPVAYRHALFCNSLKQFGWNWQGDEFVKPPEPSK